MGFCASGLPGTPEMDAIWDPHGTILGTFFFHFGPLPPPTAPPDNPRSLQPTKPLTNQAFKQPSLPPTKSSTNPAFNQPSLQPTKPSTNQPQDALCLAGGPGCKTHYVLQGGRRARRIMSCRRGWLKAGLVEDLVGGRLGCFKAWLVKGFVG